MSAPVNRDYWTRPHQSDRQHWSYGRTGPFSRDHDFERHILIACACIMVGIIGVLACWWPF